MRLVGADDAQECVFDVDYHPSSSSSSPSSLAVIVVVGVVVTSAVVVVVESIVFNSNRVPNLFNRLVVNKQRPRQSSL